MKPRLYLAIFSSVVFATSSLLAAQQVRVVATPEGGAVPDAEVSPDGRVHLAYVKDEDAFYASSTDGGKTFTKSIRINSEPGTVHPANMFRGPDIAVGKNGRVHVIWYVNAYQRKLPQDQWGVFYAHKDSNESAFTKPINLNHKPSDNYSLAADSNGNVAVVWMAGRLFLNTSIDNGETFSPAELVNNADPCECCASRASYSSSGSLMIDYRDKAQNIRDMFVLSRAPGTERFTKSKISETPWQVTGCPMTGTFLGRGRTEEIAAWETKGAVFFGRIDSKTGQLKTHEVKVADQGKWPIALAGNDGSVVVSWKTSERLFWQVFDAGDKPNSNGDKPTGNNSRHAGVVLRNGDCLLID